jgi:hypothetical protein
MRYIIDSTTNFSYQDVNTSSILLKVTMAILGKWKANKIIYM